jgi:PleD family two-component response regulator
MSRITAADILKVVPITRKTLWLWQKKYRFFPDPQKEGHPGGKGIVSYYPAWVKDRCKQVYALQNKGYTIAMIQEIIEKEKKDKSARKVLVVDDEIKFCDLLKQIFQKNNFLVETAYDWWEAGKKAAEFKPTIIILNITLAGINGLQVCRNLRADPKTENIKIISFSGELRYSEAEVLEAGVNSILTKPVNFKILLSLCNDFFTLPELQK